MYYTSYYSSVVVSHTRVRSVVTVEWVGIILALRYPWHGLVL
jgi:hypothetical protein